MAGVMYNTKTNSQEVERVLDNPATGRALIKKLLIDREKVQAEPGITVQTSEGERKFTVRELTFGSSVSNR
jgi:hypothetical protein